MFDKVFLTKIKYLAIFVVIYTIIFFLFFSILPYIFPFVLALIIAYLTKPLTRFLIKRLRLSRSLSSLISTLLVFIILFVIISSIIFKVTVEAKQLISSAPNLDVIRKFFENNIDKLRVYYSQIDASIIQKMQEQISSLVTKTYDIIVNIITRLFSLAIGLPVLFMIIFITFIATYFFTRDISDMEDKFLSAFSSSGREKVRRIWFESSKMFGNYIRSYSLIIFLTFLETLIGFSLIGVKYSLMLSILCAMLDILPVLGIGAVYFSLAIIYIVAQNYATAVFIILLYIAVTVIRQIVEPKLVSSSLGLHPVAVLAAIYIGIKAYGFIGMIYLIFLMVFYNILKKVKIF